MPDPEYAIVELLCDPGTLNVLKAIPNLVIQVRPLFTDDPAVIQLSALADAAAQDAARALGCTVTVVKSAEEYRQQIEEAYRDLGQDLPPSARS